ncbi:MAG: anti-sigma factor [Ilumatobacteraceae bacterium]
MSGDETRYDELLGAYALDAVDDDERHEIEEYLRVDARAAAEIDELRETAATLGWSPMAPPEGLWERIAASLEGEAPRPTGELAKVIPMAAARRRRTVIGGVLIAAAAAIVAVLAVSVVRKDSNSYSAKAAMDQARKSADAHELALTSADGTVSVDAVLDADGHGYLAGSSLPSLPSNRTYQLWGLIDGQVISLGVLGHRPGLETFSVDGNVTQLMISNETAGGVPTNANTVGVFAGTIT